MGSALYYTAEERKEEALLTNLLIAAPFVVAPFAAVAWRLRWLTFGGAVAAWIVGSTTLGFGGPSAIAVLAAFFATGTALTFLGRRRKAQPEHGGAGRDAGQVLCTGGVAAVALVLARLVGSDHATPAVWHAAFLGSLAAATADTWATEIGMLSSAPPKLITTWKPVPPGTSGGITIAGSLAGIAGAALIAAFAPIIAPAAGIAGIVAAGAAGMVFDSVLGATVQASFVLPNGAVTETPARGARLVRGLSWMTNSVVNLAATALGAVTAAVLQRGL